MKPLDLEVYRPASLSGRTSFWSSIGMPSRGERLHRALNAGLAFPIYQNLAEASAIGLYQLATYLRISRRVLRRREESGLFTPAESDRIYRFVRVFQAATDLFEGDASAAKRWLEEPAQGLGGRLPAEMTGSTAEMEGVLDLIDQLEHGVIV